MKKKSFFFRNDGKNLLSRLNSTKVSQQLNPSWNKTHIVFFSFFILISNRSDWIQHINIMKKKPLQKWKRKTNIAFNRNRFLVSLCKRQKVLGGLGRIGVWVWMERFRIFLNVWFLKKKTKIVHWCDILLSSVLYVLHDFTKVWYILIVNCVLLMFSIIKNVKLGDRIFMQFYVEWSCKMD